MVEILKCDLLIVAYLDKLQGHLSDGDDFSFVLVNPKDVSNSSKSYLQVNFYLLYVQERVSLIMQNYFLN